MENSLKSVLIGYGFEDKVANKIVLLLGNIIDDPSIIKYNKAAVKKASKFKSIHVRCIDFDSEKTQGNLKLSQCGLQGRVIDFDNKCRLELNGTSASIIKIDPENMYDAKVVLVDIFNDKKLGKIRRIRGYSDICGLDEEEFLLHAQKNCFEIYKPLFESCSSLTDELNMENKGKKTTMNMDTYFHKTVGEILSYPVKQNYKKRIK